MLFKPSHFAKPPRCPFFRFDHPTDDQYTTYVTGSEIESPLKRSEYLTRPGDQVPIHDFLNVEHQTQRSTDQAINPYLMALNALPKLRHWRQSHSELLASDMVFVNALQDCQDLSDVLTMKFNITVDFGNGTPSLMNPFDNLLTSTLR